jgi:hypothetical protein
VCSFPDGNLLADKGYQVNEIVTCRCYPGRLARSL